MSAEAGWGVVQLRGGPMVRVNLASAIQNGYIDVERDYTTADLIAAVERAITAGNPLPVHRDGTIHGLAVIRADAVAAVIV